MTLALFYYTLAVLLVSMLAAAASLAVFAVTRRRIHLFTLAGFLVYVLDVALVFRIDFGPGHRPASVYEISGPVESVLYGAALMALFSCVVLEHLGRPLRLAWVPPAVFVAAGTAAYLLIEPGKWREFAFFSARGVVVLGMLGLAAFHSVVTSDEVERARLRRHRTLFFTACGLTAGTVLWNLWFQILHEYAPWEVRTLAFLPERNFCENALLVACAVYVCLQAFRSLELRYDEAPRVTESDRRQKFVDEQLAAFARAHSLSAREAEVLRCLVQGKDNREISEELFVAVSTVKVHVHRILGKTGCANRGEVSKQFWATC